MVDYSVWDRIEVSDDEEELAKTPTLEPTSLARFRHQSRLERTTEDRRRKITLTTEIQRLNTKINTLRAQKAEPGALSELEMALVSAVSELKRLEAGAPKDVDSLSRPGFSSTRINRATPPPKDEKDDPITELKAPTGQTFKVRESEISRLETFVRMHREAADAFAKLEGAMASRDFLLRHPEIACDEAVGYLHTHCLALAEAGEGPTVVERAAGATVCLEYVVESGKEMGRSPRDPGHLDAFFTGLTTEGATMALAFREETRGLVWKMTWKEDQKRVVQVDRVSKRAATKAALALEESKASEQAEVLASLPEEMRLAFQSKDKAGLEEVGVAMGVEAFAEALDRCTKAGLWVNDLDK